MNNTIKALIGGLIVAGTAELFYQYGKGIGIGALKKGQLQLRTGDRAVKTRRRDQQRNP